MLIVRESAYKHGTKVENATSVEKFKTISLLNVEGKLFFALKSEMIMDLVLANKYIDTSIQKGGVPGISGCLEQTTVISQLRYPVN